MKQNPYAPSFDDLPDVIPIFPLTGVLLLPHGELPLNLFEQRYLSMFDAALASNRLFGMIQRNEQGELYKIGCVGKIIRFTHTADGRYEIALSGISRFKVDEELSVMTPYRQIKARWDDFKDDMNPASCLDIDRNRLLKLLDIYFQAQQMGCDWSKIEDASDARLITCLSMICPFDPKEKQALLEAKCHKTRAEMFMAMLEMTVHNRESGNA